MSIVAREAKPLFAQISDRLRADAKEASRTGRLREHVDTAFESLVLALDRTRPTISKLRVGVDDLLLLVLSTDPSPTLATMEVEAARRLNSPELFAKWHSVLHGRT